MRSTVSVIRLYKEQQPFLSVFVKFVVYLLFHPENISSKVDVIEKAN